MLTPEEFGPAVEGMAALNKYARDAVLDLDISACTDVTGFGLLGHAGELADASGVTLELDADSMPLLPRAAELAETGILPQGAYRNRQYLQGKVDFGASVPLYLQDILFDPQTSGGLLLSVPEKLAFRALRQLEAAGVTAVMVGQAVDRGRVSTRVL